jgi:hypothetical protein
VFEGGGETRLLIFEPVLDISGVSIECRLVLRHRGFEVLHDLCAITAAESLAASPASSDGNCQSRKNSK